MNKKLFVGMLALSLLPSSAFAKSSPNLFIDGQIQKADVIIKDSRTFVPLRFISENLGYKVDYFKESKGIKISNDSHVLNLKVDSSEYEKDGKTSQMDVKTFINNDRTFVPLRFISENFGKEVGWDNNSRSVYIGKKPDVFPEIKKSIYNIKEYPEFGFKLFVPKSSEDKIEFRPSKYCKGIAVYSKEVNKAGKKLDEEDLGYLGTYFLESEVDDEDYTLKILISGSKYYIGKTEAPDFIEGSGKLYDEMMRCFDLMDRIIVAPCGNKIAEFSSANADIIDGEFIYSFGNPKLYIKIPEKDLSKFQLEFFDSGIAFYDVDNYKQYGGFIRSISQDKELLEENSKITKNGNMIVQTFDARDVQYDMNHRNVYEEKANIVLNKVKIKTQSAENTMNGFTNNSFSQ